MQDVTYDGLRLQVRWHSGSRPVDRKLVLTLRSPPKPPLVSEINPLDPFCVGPQLYNIHNDDSCSVSTTNSYPRTLHFSSPPQRDVSTTSSTLHNRRLFVTRCICTLSASGATSVLTMGDPSRRPRIQPGGCGPL